MERTSTLRRLLGKRFHTKWPPTNRRHSEAAESGTRNPSRTCSKSVGTPDHRTAPPVALITCQQLTARSIAQQYVCGMRDAVGRSRRECPNLDKAMAPSYGTRPRSCATHMTCAGQCQQITSRSSKRDARLHRIFRSTCSSIA